MLPNPHKKIKEYLTLTLTTCKNILLSIKTSLENNKIFFDVFSTIFISGASLVVAYTALNINNKMLEASEISALPHFSIGTRFRLDPSTQTYVEQTLFLNNNGAPISNLNWQTKTFIVLEQSGTRKYTLIPLNGYYFGKLSTSNATGELASTVGHLNNDKFSTLYKQALEYNSKNNSEKFYFLRTMTFSKISYEDRLNRPGVIYFNEHTKISKDSAQPIFEYSQNVPLLDLGNISLKDIINSSEQPDALILNELP